MSKQHNEEPKRKYAGRGRKIEFDCAQVLHDAMMVFWRKGYDATKYEDLVRETGVQRYGLYKVLGDKDEAFIKVTDHYVGDVIKNLTAPMRETDANLKDIYTYFETIKHFNTEQPIGCMVCNTIAGNRERSDDVSELNEKMLLMVRDSIKNALDGAINQNELKPDTDLDTLSYALLGTMVGASTLFRSKLGSDSAIAFIDQSLKLLDLYKT